MAGRSHVQAFAVLLYLGAIVSAGAESTSGQKFKIKR